MKDILDELISMGGLSPSNKVEYANVYFRELDDIETAINILSGLQNEFIQKFKFINNYFFQKR